MKKIWMRGICINLSLLFCALLYAALFTLDRRLGIGIFDCYWKEVFGINCPGCGGSRAVLCLLRWDPIGALRYSPGVVLGVWLLLWYDATLLVTLVRRDPKRRVHFPVVSLVSLPVVFLLVFLLRLYKTLVLGIPPI